MSFLVISRLFVFSYIFFAFCIYVDFSFGVFEYLCFYIDFNLIRDFIDNFQLTLLLEDTVHVLYLHL